MAYTLQKQMLLQAPLSLSDEELDVLLRFLQRIQHSSEDDTVRRVAKSLFTLLTQEKYND